MLEFYARLQTTSFTDISKKLSYKYKMSSWGYYIKSLVDVFLLKNNAASFVQTIFYKIVLFNIVGLKITILFQILKSWYIFPSFAIFMKLFSKFQSFFLNLLHCLAKSTFTYCIIQRDIFYIPFFILNTFFIIFVKVPSHESFLMSHESSFFYV